MDYLEAIKLNRKITEKQYDFLFKLFLGGKAIYGCFEIIVGLFLLVISHSSINMAFLSFLHRELAEEPTTLVFGHIFNFLINLTHSTQTIIGVYLLIYGVIKLILIYDLLKNQIRMYPYAIGVFVMAVLFQIYKLTGHFHGLLFWLTIYDIIAIGLVWHHYDRLKLKYCSS